MIGKMHLYLVLLAFAAMAVPSFAQSTGSGALTIYSLSVSPNPVFAGENVTISLQLYDSFSAVLNNVNLELEGSYPILNVSPSNPYLISSMSEGVYGGETTFFTYHIRIPKNTPSGNYTLELDASYQTTETTDGESTLVTGTSVMPISFYVHGTPQISINPTVTRISPGNASTISISVMNSGYGTARNITIDTLSTSNFSATGTRTFYIGSIAPGASTALTTTYLVNSHITNGTYTLPIYVSYQSDQGIRYNQTINQTLGVKIQNPNIVATIVSANPSTLYTGYNQTLVLDFQNIGYGSADNVSINVAPIAGINILSSIRHFFIGTLAAGQSTTESLVITATNSTTGKLGIAIGYYSSNYQSQFMKNQTLNISIAPSAIFNIGTGRYDLLPGETAVPLNITITNTGNVDAQQVQLSFQSSYPLTPVASTDYIPELKPGQSANVSFLVSVDSHGVPGTYPIIIYESWRQPNGAVQQTYTGSNNYYATVSGGSLAGGYLVDIVAVAIVVIIVAMVYRRMAKGKQQSKKK